MSRFLKIEVLQIDIGSIAMADDVVTDIEYEHSNVSIKMKLLNFQPNLLLLCLYLNFILKIKIVSPKNKTKIHFQLRLWSPFSSAGHRFTHNDSCSSTLKTGPNMKRWTHGCSPWQDCSITFLGKWLNCSHFIHI